MTRKVVCARCGAEGVLVNGYMYIEHRPRCGVTAASAVVRKLVCSDVEAKALLG